MDATEILAILSNATLAEGGFTSKGMIFALKISTLPGPKYDRLKPSAMGLQVEETSPCFYQNY